MGGHAHLWGKCYSNKDTLRKVMSAKYPYIQKYLKRKAKASLCIKLFLLFFWPAMYLKYESVHRFFKSKKWMNIMYKCDYGSWHFYHSCLHVNSGIMIDLKKKRQLIFTPLRCHGLSVLVYWHLLVRLWVELFVSKAWYKQKLPSVKNIHLEKRQKWEQNKSKNWITLYE